MRAGLEPEWESPLSERGGLFPGDGYLVAGVPVPAARRP